MREKCLNHFSDNGSGSGPGT